MRIINKILNKINKVSTVMIIILAIYEAFIIVYDFAFLTRNDRLYTYILVLCICVIVWFGIRPIFWVQRFNQMYGEQFQRVFMLVMLIFFSIALVVLSVEFFANGFNISLFVGSTVLQSLLVLLKSYMKNGENG